MSTLKVLIVEDDRTWNRSYSRSLRNLDLTLVATIESAKKVINEMTFDVVVLDGCIEGYQYNTDVLIEQLKQQNFSGEIIAASSSEAIRHKMTRDGCDKEMPKNEVITYLKSLTEK